jgi:hypothetical protein
MQNREELRQKRHASSRKTMCQKRGKNIIIGKGKEGQISFGPKYRPRKKYRRY